MHVFENLLDFWVFLTVSLMHFDLYLCLPTSFQRVAQLDKMSVNVLRWTQWNILSNDL